VHNLFKQIADLLKEGFLAAYFFVFADFHRIKVIRNPKPSALLEARAFRNLGRSHLTLNLRRKLTSFSAFRPVSLSLDYFQLPKIEYHLII